MAYNSAYKGSQVDSAVGAVLEKESTWDGKQDALTFDTIPTQDSQNPVTSDGIATALDDKANKSTSFSVTLTVSGWSNSSQTVSNAELIANGYSYVVSPDPDSYDEYTSCIVRADDVTYDGSITFYCAETPSTNLTVNILKIEVEN